MIWKLFNPYLWAVKVREKLYLKGVLKRCRPKAVVVSIGNLSVGGTGKTPTTSELAKFFSSRGVKTAILLRGYGRKTRGALLVSAGDRPLLGVEEAGDEAFLYASRLKGVAVAVAERRCEGARLLEETFNPDLILLDDGFQHLAIERDFDIVLLTPRDLRDRVLPFGRLREPLSALRRANFCLFSKTSPPHGELERLCLQMGKPFGYLEVVGYRLLTPEGEEVPFETLKGRKVGIVSAVGDNKGFQNTLKGLANRYGFQIVETLAFPDHYGYEGVKLDPSLLWITTFKDLYKLRERTNARLLVLDREIRLPKNLLEELEKVVR